MDLAYQLTGRFVEACNCRVICPCWVDDDPDEDHCAGLFAWTFAPGSTIEGHDVGGRSVVSATVHGDSRRGGGSTSAIFVDDALPAAAATLLVEAFAGRAGGALADLAGVTGEVVTGGRADVTVTETGEGWEVAVRTGPDARLVHAAGAPKRFDGSTRALSLQDTALTAELGAGDAVTAQESSVLVINVMALPGPPVDVLARSAMTGTFDYRGKRDVLADAGAAGEPVEPAGDALADVDA